MALGWDSLVESVEIQSLVQLHGGHFDVRAAKRKVGTV